MLLFLLLLQSALAQTEVGSRACAACHAGIVRSYQQTGMARTSGRAGDALEQASAQPPAGYRISTTKNGFKLEFAEPPIAVERTLAYFIGSGSLGRSYLFSLNGFLFQAPLSYYTAAAKFDISPGFEHLSHGDFSRAVEPACLQCHASRLQPIPQTLNGFRTPPFLENGVSCERCHGPASEHIRTAGKRGIVNPTKLAPARRDSVCAQCHLTGAARIARANASPYRPGALLSDSLAVYVWSNDDAGVSATSHFEMLAQSGCARASKDKLWCGSCHNPHSSAVEYNTRCATCHQSAQCQRGPDCISCHMPKAASPTMNHIAFTDHSIPRKPKSSTRSLPLHTNLIPFWSSAASPRDEAIAYAVVAQTEPALRPRAFELLSLAADKSPRDVPLLAQLAQFHDRTGQESRAAEIYERILAIDPHHVAALVNLGAYRIQNGNPDEAISLWERALLKAPGHTGARMNLAVARFRSGDKAGAVAELEKALQFDPTNRNARKLLDQMNATP